MKIYKTIQCNKILCQNTYSLCAQSDVKETDGAFDANMYKMKVAQVKINGNHKIDAIVKRPRSICTPYTTSMKTGYLNHYSDFEKAFNKVP